MGFGGKGTVTVELRGAQDLGRRKQCLDGSSCLIHPGQPLRILAEKKTVRKTEASEVGRVSG